MINYIIGAIVILLIYFAVKHTRKTKGGCDCGCGGCSAESSCNVEHKK